MPKLNFTINVSLKSFFADNRTRAKLFIDENIKNISNLEEKITRIFGIKHFYLLNNGQLLPSCEDIRILDKDAVIRVVPNNFLPPKLLLDDEYYVIDDDIVNNKNKKKKH
ncbi:hypothetical protein HHI36_002788 [Cryptolaemus montrouzieri]|uniref:Coilin N-terminal domain-containing protein n=1 Tax=Cryptolaemus montrouzieri TaxID=559131 RepID=A0ABD2PBZ1_9CUCU